MDDSEIKTIVMDVIRDCREPGLPEALPEQKLHRELGFDSLESVNLVLQVERRLDIDIPFLDSDITVEDFITSVRKIKNETINSKLQTH